MELLPGGYGFIFSGQRKKNQFVAYCRDNFKDFADRLSQQGVDEASQACAVNPCKVFEELGRIWQLKRQAERDKLQCDGLASLSEAYDTSNSGAVGMSFVVCVSSHKIMIFWASSSTEVDVDRRVCLVQGFSPPCETHSPRALG